MIIDNIKPAKRGKQKTKFRRRWLGKGIKITTPSQRYKRFVFVVLGLLVGIILIVANYQTLAKPLIIRSLAKPGKYLVLFENANDLTPAGGKIESVFTVELTRQRHLGEIKAVEYLPDVPTNTDTADLLANVARSYQQKTGQGFDGVVVINGSIATNATDAISKLSQRPRVEVRRQVEKWLKTKDVVFWFPDKRRLTLEKLGLADRLPVGDYLYISSENTGESKTSNQVDQNIEIKINKKSKTVDLFISRTNRGSQKDQSRMEVFVPTNSELVSGTVVDSSKGEKIDSLDRSDYKIYTFPLITPAGESSSAWLSYKINSKIRLSPLAIIKQPMAQSQSIRVVVDNKVVFEGILGQNVSIKI